MIRVVIPCFNEAARLKSEEFSQILTQSSASLVFVNDGSSDKTLELLKVFREQYPGRVEIVNLIQNMGKGEAVREGLKFAIKNGASWIAYIDADMATPASEVLRIIGMIEGSPYKVFMGSRVRLLGTEIIRNPWRHYFGRVFATLASMTLKCPVYDTQCGAKFFKVTDALKMSLQRPFMSRWIFDVELLGRLLKDGGYGIEDFKEVPLLIWRDVAGSKVTLGAVFRSALELTKLYLKTRGQI